MTGRLSGLTARIKEVAPESESTHCLIRKEVLTNRKMSPEFNSVLIDVVKARLSLNIHSPSWCTIIYLSLILKEFERYFPTTKDPRTGNEWIYDPFVNKSGEYSMSVQDQLLKIANECGLKTAFETTSLPVFWNKAMAE
ncbi:uncharacterized protein TNCV_427081 [Trichonephila clavipes]|nr:uncharacterized protein TNCV_427081 [Trichonephila clavipes]